MIYYIGLLGLKSGLTSAEWADSVIRCLPEDSTNGFFVSCFVRVDPSTMIPGDAKGAVSVAGAGKRKRGKGDAIPAETPSAQPDDINKDVDGNSTVPATVEMEEAVVKDKTEAQAERVRRKKLAQRKRRKVEGGGAIEADDE